MRSGQLMPSASAEADIGRGDLALCGPLAQLYDRVDRHLRADDRVDTFEDVALLCHLIPLMGSLRTHSRCPLGGAGICSWRS